MPFIVFFNLPFCAGQDIPAAQTAEKPQAKPIDLYKISVNVDEVTLDVVVVDKKGHPITDLTAEDFEVVYPFKLSSPANSSVYIYNKSGTAAWNERKDAANLPQFSSRTLKETDKKNSAKRDKGGVASKGEGIFSKLARAYLGTAKNFTVKEEKGISSRTLGFRIVADAVNTEDAKTTGAEAAPNQE